MIQLAIFDLDGTLVNTIADLAGALNNALEQNGFPTLTQSEVEAIVGYSTAYMFAHAVPESCTNPQECVGPLYQAYYSRHCCDHSRPYEGMTRAVGKLKDAGVKLAVVTNKPHRDAITVIDTLFPRDTFSMVLGRMDKFPTKPAPDALQFALDFFGVDKEHAVYIGDSEVDIRFAANVGIPCISVPWGYRSRKTLIEAGAVTIIDEPEELVELLTR